jgi:DNA replication licensing factor MCM4
VSDVNEASRLLREAIKDYATDPKTGRIDMDLILSGTGSHDRHVKDDRARELKALLLNYESSSVGWTKLLNDFNEQSDVVKCYTKQLYSIDAMASTNNSFRFPTNAGY